MLRRLPIVPTIVVLIAVGIMIRLGFWQLDRLRAWVAAGLSRITRPTLLIHAKDDEVTSPRSVQDVVYGMKAGLTTCLELENSYHMVCIDNDKEIVVNRIMYFLGGENPHAQALAKP